MNHLSNSIFISFLFVFLFINFNFSSFGQNKTNKKNDVLSCCTEQIPNRFAFFKNKSIETTSEFKNVNQGMILIKGGMYKMGSSDDLGRSDEYPVHQVFLHDFLIDKTEVTNAQFAKFVDATGYVTTAEIAPDWEEIKKQFPPETPKPDDSLLVASSLVFITPNESVDLNHYETWWEWRKNTNWRQPEGIGSTIIGKENYPVVHVSYDDATAYAKWAGKRLPTEAEWEYSARGGMVDKPFTWGSENAETGKPKANTWQGIFPTKNGLWDQYETAAPVGSFEKNGYGLYDMAGNVWEWCSDWYSATYYSDFKNNAATNPKGPSKPNDPADPKLGKRVLRGGSFLCHSSYCSGYRVSARMKNSPDTSSQHTGFRCVKDLIK